MEIYQWRSGASDEVEPRLDASGIDLILCFGQGDTIAGIESPLTAIEESFPRSVVVGCSTPQYFQNGLVHSSAIGVSAIDLGDAATAAVPIDLSKGWKGVAGRVTDELLERGTPSGIFLLWDDASPDLELFLLELEYAINSVCPVSGGVASDRFTGDSIAVMLGSKRVDGVAIAFYGADLEFSTGAATGWEREGPVHIITRAEGNKIYEISGRSALDVYKEHLGEHAEGLPTNSVHYPLEIIPIPGHPGVMRIPKEINALDGSITCAGQISGREVRMMTFSSSEDLFSGATRAARRAAGMEIPNFSLLNSCVSRGAILGPICDMEMSLALQSANPSGPNTGFYSYGQIAQSPKTGRLELLNLSMSATCLREREAQTAFEAAPRGELVSA